MYLSVLYLSALRLLAWGHSSVSNTSRGLSDSASMRQIRSGHEPDPLWDAPDPLWASRTSKAHVLVFEPRVFIVNACVLYRLWRGLEQLL